MTEVWTDECPNPMLCPNSWVATASRSRYSVVGQVIKTGLSEWHFSWTSQACKERMAPHLDVVHPTTVHRRRNVRRRLRSRPVPAWDKRRVPVLLLEWVMVRPFWLMSFVLVSLQRVQSTCFTHIHYANKVPAPMARRNMTWKIWFFDIATTVLFILFAT